MPPNSPSRAARLAASKIPSRAEPGPLEAPYSHRGLTYPLGRTDPAEGEIVPVAAGLGWARLPIPGPLKHVNVWVLAEGEDVTLVDAGLDSAACRAGWEALIAGRLDGKRVQQVIVTHFHPDHLGLAGWLCRRFEAPLLMTRTEWLFGRMLESDVRDAPPPEATAYWRAAGWSDAQIAAESAKGWGRFASAVSPVPLSFTRLAEGDRLEAGGRGWRVITGCGHSPEHACLLDEEAGIFIAGDQVLPRISSNVSLSLSEPDGDPLGDWLASIAKLRQLPGDLLVLPSHGEPFTGLHARLEALDAAHRERLDALHLFLAEPRRAVDCFGLLFARQIDDRSLGLATGEAMAHLRRLEVEGRATRQIAGGVHWYGAC